MSIWLSLALITSVMNYITTVDSTRVSLVLKIKMFAEGWVVYPRTSGSPERASCQVGSGDIKAHVLQLINTI